MIIKTYNVDKTDNNKEQIDTSKLSDGEAECLECLENALATINKYNKKCLVVFNYDTTQSVLAKGSNKLTKDDVDNYLNVIINMSHLMK